MNISMYNYKYIDVLVKYTKYILKLLPQDFHNIFFLELYTK